MIINSNKFSHFSWLRLIIIMKRQEVKILHLITELSMGGAQDNTLLSLKGLKEKGYQIDIAAAPGGVWESLARTYSDNVFHINAFSANKIYLVKNIEAIWQVYKLLKQHKYHIIHTHSTTAGICGRIAAKIADVPVIIHTVHGFAFHDFMPPLKKNCLILLEKLAALFCDYMITVSKLNLKEILDRKIAPESKLINVYSGIDLDKFVVSRSSEEIKTELNIPAADLVVGLVARLSEQKAPQYFIEAAKIILKQKEHVTFIIVGEGPLQEHLLELIGTESKINILGARSNVPEILSVLDVFALSSIYEGLGRAMTEAMASKKPVVVPDINGIPEVVTDGETGLLFKPKDSAELAEKILLLLNDANLRIKLGENAYNRVVPEFSDKIMVDSIDKLYCLLFQNKLNIKID